MQMIDFIVLALVGGMLYIAWYLLTHVDEDDDENE